MPQQQHQQQQGQYQQAQFDDQRQGSNFKKPQPVQQYSNKKQNNGQQQQQQQYSNKQQGGQPRANDPFYYQRVSALLIPEYNAMLWFAESSLFDSWGNPYLRARKHEYFAGYIYWPPDGSAPQIISLDDPDFDAFKADVDYTMSLLAIGLNKSVAKGGRSTRVQYRNDWRWTAFAILSFVGFLYLLLFRG